jgi:hypothetical protein
MENFNYDIHRNFYLLDSNNLKETEGDIQASSPQETVGDPQDSSPQRETEGASIVPPVIDNHMQETEGASIVTPITYSPQRQNRANQQYFN